MVFILVLVPFILKRILNRLSIFLTWGLMILQSLPFLYLMP